MTGLDCIRAWTLSGTLNFTRYFFKETSGRSFLVGDHHRAVCDALDGVIDGKTKKLIINIAPRYGKTELAVKDFIAMGLALNPRAKFIHLSYSGDLALENSVAIKDIVTCEAYQRLFPARIKRGSDTKSEWDTVQGGGVYATSTLGQITGFGAGAVDVPGERWRFSGAVVIDDPIKPEDALSDNMREAVNRRFETTIRNRVNSRDTPIIIIMQRLHERDLCGYLQEVEPDAWELVSIPCIGTDANGGEKALWELKHSLAELHHLADINPFVFETQYMQNPRPLEGLMYREFKTYTVIPNERKGVRKNYTDSADTGADWHCSVDYVERPEGNYVLDVLYTKRSQEYTEPVQAEMLARDGIEECAVESNNGGRAFGRNVERLSREMGNARTRFIFFAQTANKRVRIFTRANEVCNLTYFPEDWERRWPEFARDLKAYRKEGRNANDDAPDAVTGMVERRDPDGAASKDAFADFL